MSQTLRSAGRIAVVAVAVVAVAAMGAEVARRGRFAVPLSSYSTGHDGARALMLLAEREGVRVHRWKRNLTALPRGRGVLVAVGRPWDDLARPLGRAERDALVRWVQGGGTLVVLGAKDYLPDSLGVSVSEERSLDKEERPRPARQPRPWDDPEILARLAVRERAVDAVLSPGHRLTRGLSRLRLIGPGHLKPTDGDWERVATGPKQDWALARPVGRGHVAVVASASFLTNGALGEGDHAAFALRLLRLGRAPVLFDELHLGMGTSESLAQYAREHGFGLVALQILLAAMLWLWSRGAWFGAPRSPPPPRAADPTHAVEALGRIYARAADVRASMERLAAHAFGRIAARHGVTAADPVALAASLRGRGRARAATAVDALAGRLDRARAADRPPTPHALVEFSRAIDDDIAPALKSTLEGPP